jgi:hypothetical membrane protein
MVKAIIACFVLGIGILLGIGVYAENHPWFAGWQWFCCLGFVFLVIGMLLWSYRLSRLRYQYPDIDN